MNRKQFFTKCFKGIFAGFVALFGIKLLKKHKIPGKNRIIYGHFNSVYVGPPQDFKSSFENNKLIPTFACVGPTSRSGKGLTFQELLEIQRKEEQEQLRNDIKNYQRIVASR